MLRRFSGLLLICVGVAMAVAGCGESTGAGAGESVRRGYSLADYPTVTRTFPDAKDPAAVLTGVAAFNAQRAKGWPTPEGLPNSTAAPSPTPIDKSNWTIVEPGGCDSIATTRAEDLDELRRKIFRFISRSWADDIRGDVVDGADLIIHGVPVGDIEMEPASGSGFFDRFYQEVRILSVLSGQAPGDTVRVVQIASDFAISEEYLERDKTTLGSGENDGYYGPLGQCPQILFLSESAADTYLSIGLTQGFFSLGADGRVTYAPGFEPLDGWQVSTQQREAREHKRVGLAVDLDVLLELDAALAVGASLDQLCDGLRHLHQIADEFLADAA